MLSPETLRASVIRPLPLAGFWRLLAFLGLWPHHPGLCLRGHLAFSSICVKSALLL